jgi:FkbM family methyltransferase
MARSAPGGNHVAFEPLPDYAVQLATQFPTVDVRRVALSRASGESEFVRPVGLDAYSGLRQRDYPHVPARLERFKVRVSTLDEELSSDYAPTLIKVDAEGGEYDILVGAEQTIRKHRPILAFEHGPRASENYGVTHSDLFDLLVDLGYRVLDMDGVGPYSRDRFVEASATSARFNYLGKP